MFFIGPEKPGPSPPRRDLGWAMPVPHCGGQSSLALSEESLQEFEVN